MSKKAGTKTSAKKIINLALQGGGAHGAFTWGTLDRLLEEDNIEIEGITATSAGSVNACALAYGMQLGKQKNGRKKAQETLHNVWEQIYKAGAFYTPAPAPLSMEPFLSWNMDYSPAYFFFDSLTRMFSPYQLNPLNINPLRDVLNKSLDFKEIRKCSCIKLFISATHVKTGKVCIFNTPEIDLDVVMASACLPFMFKAVEIEGEHYWDGGYMGNPALYPLFYNTKSRDIMIVHINPMVREDLPVTAPEIMNRVNEISFNSSLIKEMRAISFVKKLLGYDMLKEKYRKDFKDVLVHSIRSDDVMNNFSVASKFNSSWDFLTYLRDAGRQSMETWLSNHYDDLNENDTVDLNEEFLSSIDEIYERHITTKDKKTDMKDIA